MLQITVRHCSQQKHSRWFVSVSTRGALSCFVVVSTKGGAVTGLCARQNETGKLYGAPTGGVGGFFFPHRTSGSGRSNQREPENHLARI